ncbi:hypothetical protein THAOC_24562, partial [Thalassiosira oceanica]
ALRKRIQGPDEVLRAFSEGPPGKILLLGGDFMLHEGIRGGWPRNEGSVGGILGQIVGSGPRSELDPELDPSDGTAQDTPEIQEERSCGVTHGMAGHDLLSGHALRRHVDETLKSIGVKWCRGTKAGRSALAAPPPVFHLVSSQVRRGVLTEHEPDFEPEERKEEEERGARGRHEFKVYPTARLGRV